MLKNFDYFGNVVGGTPAYYHHVIASNYVTVAPSPAVVLQRSNRDD